MSGVNAGRMALIDSALRSALGPVSLTIEDESHLHAGHAGAKTGMGHFHVVVVAEAFEGLRMLQRHRLIYDAVGNLMNTDIHALRIDAKASSELQIST